MDRNEAEDLVREKISDENLVKHMLAVEASMRELASHFEEDEDEWGIAGLLHDLDYEKTEEDPDSHGLVTVEMLKDYDLSTEQLNAIKAHCGQKEPETQMEKAIHATDPLTGLIVAGALVHPEGLEEMDVQFVRNRFEEKSFARSADRDTIKKGTELDLSLEEFFGIVLSGMQKIKDKLDL